MRRTEFPDPQKRRADWQCLNGAWEFEIDNEKSGFARGLLHNRLASSIEVPFSPESKLSGVHYTDFIRACWYRAPFYRSRGTAGGAGGALFRRRGFRGESIRKRRIRRRAPRRIFAFFLRHNRPFLRTVKTKLRSSGGRRFPQSAERQAVAPQGIVRVFLHAHHGDMAERLSRIHSRGIYPLFPFLSRRGKRPRGNRNDHGGQGNGESRSLLPRQAGRQRGGNGLF